MPPVQHIAFNELLARMAHDLGPRDVRPHEHQRGRILQPDLGVRLVDQRRLRRAGFEEGVMIQQVEPDSPAAKAGLHGLGQDPDTGDVDPGDLILAIDGQPVEGNADFARRISNYKVGDKLKLKIERDGKRFEVEVTLRGV